MNRYLMINILFTEFIVRRILMERELRFYKTRIRIYEPLLQSALAQLEELEHKFKITDNRNPLK